MTIARTLLYDIETSPNISYTWGKWQQDVLDFEQEWFILSCAFKWMGESKVSCIGMDEYPKDLLAKPPTDIKIVEKMHALFSEADVCVAHNGNSFDSKKAQARMLVHGFDPPRPYQQVDTCLVARRYFNFNSNKLTDLGQILGVGKKAPTGGFQLWLDCMANDPVAWKKMRRYNKQDVVLLEQVYLKMLPWIEGHPNIALIEGDMENCPRCGEDAMTRQGFKVTRTMTYQQWKCSACGGWSRTRASEKTEKPKFVN